MKHNIVERELKKIHTDVASIVPYFDKPDWDTIMTAGVAAVIASVYSGYESIFRYLCENKIEKSEHWHKDLLDKAIAKGFVPLGTERILSDMLSFRHIQRNYYGHQLKESEVRKKAAELVNVVIPAFDKHLQNLTV